jgi:hypothetical protein
MIAAMGDSLRGGRFVPLGPLGEGAQGHTLDGIDKREGRAVAIKRFDVRGAKGWKDVELAESEARVLSSLSHPKLPAYIDHFEEDGALYLVMEKIEGESLAALRKRGVVLGEEDVLQLLRDAGDVLDYLHRRAPAVIHRDLKPGNVIRRPGGSFAFVDFGAVREKLKPEGGSTVVGTFGYMAPEQFQGRALPGSDVYAIGATALTMLTGVDPETLPHKGLAIDVRAALRGRASRELVDILEKMLDPDPDTRASQLSSLLAAPRASSADERLPNHKRRRKQAEDFGRDVERTAREFEERMQREAREYEERMERAAGTYQEHQRERQRRRREEREARKRARRRHRGSRGMSAWPFPLNLLASFAIAVAAMVVWIGLYYITRTILATLSVIFGPKLLAASNAVARAAVIAMAALRSARVAIMRGFVPPRAEEREPDRVRVADQAAAPLVDGGEAPRVRVEGTPIDEYDELEEEEDAVVDRKRSKK